MQDIRNRYSKEDVVEIIRECRQSIILTMDILRTELGITSTQILPSETALVPLFQYIYQKGNKPIAEPSLINWFILASFNGVYSSRTDTRLEDDLKIVKNAKDGFPFKDLLKSMKEKINKDKISEGDFKNIEKYRYEYSTWECW